MPSPVREKGSRTQSTTPHKKVATVGIGYITGHLYATAGIDDEDGIIHLLYATAGIDDEDGIIPLLYATIAEMV